MNKETLWQELQGSKQPLTKFKVKGGYTACIYPDPFKGISEVVRWFYSRNNRCQVFYACSQQVSDKIDADSWADVSQEFTEWVEMELMPYCVENTDWEQCDRYGIEYDKKIPKKLRSLVGYEFGCSGTICACEPFGQGDFTNGIAERNEFNIKNNTSRV